MCSLIDDVELFDIQNRIFRPAQLYDGVGERNISDVEAKWKPLFDRATISLVSACQDKKENLFEDTLSKKIESLHIQDCMWDWRKKHKALSSDEKLSYRGFSIVCDKVTEGLMYVNVGPTKRCRIDSQKNQLLVYIEFIATAPWNRKKFMEFIKQDPRHAGVGTIFIETAIALSLKEEFNGRIGLHSLPQAETFYKQKGMIDLGPDPDKQNLNYFEMTEEIANNFINTQR